MSLGQLTSDVFLSCTPTAVAVGATILAGTLQRPAPAATFTTEYSFTAPAACPTAEWTATYTIREVCTGDPATWTRPPVPPNFVKTVVTCDVCAHKTQTITCPVELAVQTGPVRIHGDGVTATPALAAATATAAANMGAAAAGSGGSTSGSDISGPNSGSAAAAAAAIVGSNSFSGGGSSASNLGLGADDMFATVAMPGSGAETEAASTTYDTAGAPGMKISFVLVSGAIGLGLVASQLLL
ncbi:hypothetical protein VSDG_06620 [Cytospora chrysosperma]|uniref:Uncharacterized protein n=1 Tax=Cytospora chrysosperma TaxID=252740 RepID=A0A423VNW5_CYTCH|nr:hypothetical protein VSDG_06620 [Valsa sordida]